MWYFLITYGCKPLLHLCRTNVMCDIIVDVPNFMDYRSNILKTLSWDKFLSHRDGSLHFIHVPPIWCVILSSMSPLPLITYPRYLKLSLGISSILSLSSIFASCIASLNVHLKHSVLVLLNMNSSDSSVCL